MGRTRRPWTKVYGPDLLASSRYRALGERARLVYLELLIGYTDEEGLVYAWRNPDETVQAYGSRELAEELRIPHSTLRRCLDALLRVGLVERREDGVLAVPRFSAKAGTEAKEKVEELNGKRQAMAQVMIQGLAAAKAFR